MTSSRGMRRAIRTALSLSCSGAERFLLEHGAQSLVTRRPRAADVMVGPEGGIEHDERMLIVDRYGWLPVSLGDTTLRFETAGVIAAGVLRGLLANA